MYMGNSYNFAMCAHIKLHANWLILHSIHISIGVCTNQKMLESAHVLSTRATLIFSNTQHHLAVNMCDNTISHNLSLHHQQHMLRSLTIETHTCQLKLMWAFVAISMPHTAAFHSQQTSRCRCNHQYHYITISAITSPSVPLHHHQCHYIAISTITSPSVPLHHHQCNYISISAIASPSVPLLHHQCHYITISAIASPSVPLHHNQCHYNTISAITSPSLPLHHHQ